MSPKLLAASLFEYALVATGWILIWWFFFSAKARAQRTTPALPHWKLSATGFGLAAFCVFTGWFSTQVLASALVKTFPILKTDETLMTIVGGSLAEICLIAGTVAAVLFIRKTEPGASSKNSQTTPTSNFKKTSLLPAAFITCIVTIAVVHLVQYLWEWILILCHLPTEKQDMVEIFFRTASPLRLLGLATMAVILAPIAEELVFRAGLFRYFRGRLPRWAALSLPALFFAALHVNYTTLTGLITVAPLTALGMIFSLAYERTGRIAVPILAHALFNLHTVLFLLLGIG
jgi:uncharacterized protein